MFANTCFSARRVSALLAAALLPLTPLASGSASAASGQGAPQTVSDMRPPTGLLFGAYVDASGVTSTDATPATQLAIDQFESRIGRKLDLHRVYLLWDDVMPATVKASITRQRTPVLSIQPLRRNGSKVAWRDIANGHVDATIARHADAVKALGVPVYLAFHHEPEVRSTGYGTSADFRAAWQRFVRVFRSRAVTNVAWTWTMTPTPFRAGTADQWYPGDNYVNWMALDAYNWFGCAPGLPTTWRPLSDAAGAFRAYGIRHGKPLMLAEWGSVEDPARPGRKAAWLKESMQTLRSWPEVKAVSYFHTRGTCSWHMNSSTSSQAAFAEIANAASAHGRASARLSSNTKLGVAPLSVSLDGSTSAGANASTGAGVRSWSLDFGDGSTPVSGTGRPPAVRHTYGAGTWTARLTIRDAYGNTAVDRRTVRAVGAPRVTASEAGITSSGATLKTWVNPRGLAAKVTFQWGTSTAYGASAVKSVPAQSYAAALSHAVSGLRPGRRYYWRVVASSAAGTTVVARYVNTAR